MLGTPQSSQNEPQNLTTSQVNVSQPVVMAPPHHPPWHMHSNQMPVMFPPGNPAVSQEESASQQQQSNQPQQSQEVSQNSQGHMEPLTPEQIPSLSSPMEHHHSIWSTPELDTPQNNGVDTNYNITELQNSTSDPALNQVEVEEDVPEPEPEEEEEEEEEEIDIKPKIIKKEVKKKRKLADLLAEGIDPTKLEENSEQVRERFEKGCECEGDNCFKHMNPEFVFRHRLNIAELTKNEHDLYLMGVTMACLANPEETSRHRERKRLRASYVFQGKKVCLDAFLYLENCTHYQLKAIRKHVMVNGVTPRIHGNHGKKPPNTFPLDTYQHAAAFLSSYIVRYSPNPTTTPKKSNKSGKSPPVFLPADITRKKIHNAYKEYCEHFEPDVKIMGYSSFRTFMKEQFPNVKFFRLEKKNERHSDDEENGPNGGQGSNNQGPQEEEDNSVEANFRRIMADPPKLPRILGITSPPISAPPPPPVQPNPPQPPPVSMPAQVPISSNYQTAYSLPLNLQTQQPLYSACMQPGIYPPGQPHPSQVRPPGFPYTNL